MPFDGSDIADLDEYIQWVGNRLNNAPVPTLEWEIKANEIGQRLLKELRRERDSKQRQLEAHRRRSAERGIKY